MREVPLLFSKTKRDKLRNYDLLSCYLTLILLNEMMWTAGIQMKWVCDHRSESQFKQLRKARKKKVFRGFNGIRTRGLCVSAAVLSQLSYEDPYTGGWPIYWVHQPVKGVKHWMKWCELREYKWNEYVTIAVNRNLSNCEKIPKKSFSGLQRDSNPRPLR